LINRIKYILYAARHIESAGCIKPGRYLFPFSNLYFAKLAKKEKPVAQFN
jgi:hypothetical protein